MKLSRIGIIRGVLPAFVAIILVVSLVPERWGVDSSLVPAWFNVGHLPAYFVLTALSVSWNTACSKLDLYRLLWIGAAVYGFSFVVEFLQPLVGRTFSVMDLAMNALGVLAALSLVWLTHCRIAPRTVPVVSDSATSRRRGIDR